MNYARQLLGGRTPRGRGLERFHLQREKGKGTAQYPSGIPAENQSFEHEEDSLHTAAALHEKLESPQEHRAKPEVLAQGTQMTLHLGWQEEGPL